MSHTPGPWKINRLDSKVESIVDSKGDAICLGPIKPSDALLIAAAPDLLKALKDIAEWRDSSTRWRTIALVAIAKAER